MKKILFQINDTIMVYNDINYIPIINEKIILNNILYIVYCRIFNYDEKCLLIKIKEID